MSKMQTISLDDEILDKFKKGIWILLPNKYKDIKIGTEVSVQGKKAIVETLVEGKGGRIGLKVSYESE